MLKRRLPERLMPLATSLGVRPLYGDVHNHSNLSYGHGSLADALRRAARQLDFVSITGHAHWPDMPVDDPSVAHIVAFHVEGFARLQRLWPGHFATLAEASGSGLTVFPGYEIHSGEWGDYTILYKDLTPRDIVLADGPQALRKALEARYPGAYMAFPHHIAYRQGARGINWSGLDPELSPVLEIVSMHGLSETSLGDRPFLHSMGPGDGTQTLAHGLASGHVFGVLGNTDHHSAYPGSYGHGRTCLYAAENTRQSIWDGLWARHTNALTGDCTHLLIAHGNAIQGDIVRPGPCDLRLEAVGGGPIEHIDIIRDGRLVHRISPELTPAPVDAGDGTETILVLEVGWGARGSSHRWQGTLSLDGGEILAVEPRLRGSEVVSPLEGEADAADSDEILYADNVIRFDIRAHANPNNLTPMMQAIAARIRLPDSGAVRLSFGGEEIVVPAERLRYAALSGNIGPIDSPAWRLHPLPRPERWQWQGSVPLAPLEAGETIYTRMRQSSGQWTWTSALFCRA
ncbi:hypothetical protein SAMN02983003_1724 [Devosia enhydra]|uniref:Polymerase/histidinol phosphatase N-terminal domain-containing protein n=1 Tax=Devosia enhydra TaxID=665118 RepID=A0A1K2HWT9_9HYPH|nr:hypothetical protein [Devosia enhydra]SFZ83569.1 hypothetical protein SAMN02983003_1724 [Devosia enhydra]